MTRSLLIATLFLPLTAAPQTRPPESALNITVRLFSTQAVKSLSLIPLSNDATLLICPTCPKKPVQAKLQIESTATSLTLADHTTSKLLNLEGSLRLTAAPGREITAAGRWQISPTSAGLKVLLTLPSERYVVAALNGEAAPDEPPQSLRAMAVTIRTYALTNLNRHQFDAFNLCDSTHCQALRFDKPRLEIEQAVRDTAGETLWLNNKRATIYYTQNCGGETESASNVWPTEHEPYLTSHPDPYCVRRSAANWHAQITLDQLGVIAHRQGWRLPSSIESIRVSKRSPAGRVLTLELSGRGQTAPLSASSLHFALDRELGWNQLRSDWYTVTLSNAALHFDGKGYGHGVGLCQTGTHQMAVEGHNYREILSFYFPGTHTGVASTDRGWLAIQHGAWTLRSVEPSDTLSESGARAWARARSLFPTRTLPHADVYALPTTELFREITGEPGWVRASTRGALIYLQPLSILNRNGSEEDTLLHEFLHVLVEQESTEKAPLWLREGLVEALAKPNGPSAFIDSPPTDLDSRLANQTNQQQAHAAQVEAGQRVRYRIETRGLMAIRGLLRNWPPAD
jgi:stage II sporulation protein D